MTTLPPSDSRLHSIRQQFPALTHQAYFNFGGQGPLPERSLTAIVTAHESLQRIGPFSDAANRWINQETQLLRNTLATELGATAADITITEDVTIGCNIALWGIDWRAGDQVLLSDCEHPGVLAAVQELQHRFGIEISLCPLKATLNAPDPIADPVAVIADYLRPTTRLVVLSHILWNTGQVLPIAEIAYLCHHYPAQSGPVRLLVDAAQSVGVLPLDLTQLGADFYAFTGHKWLCGPAGIGGLFIHPTAAESLRPTFIGWRGVTKTASGMPTGLHPDGRRFEVATSDYTLYGALREAIALHHDGGTVQERYQRIQTLSRYLWQRLSELPDLHCLHTAPPAAGLVAFQLATGNHATVVNALEKQGFLLRTILDPDCIRACVHYLTLETEIDRLIEALQQTVGTL